MKKLNFIHLLIGLVLLIGIYSVVKQFYMKPAVIVGEKAPDFIGLMPDGKGFKLSDLRGKYVLIDFWGSWCGPCRSEMPALAALFQKYESTKFKQANGFAIVSVALEKNREHWLQGIESLQMNWPWHTLDPLNDFKFFDSPIAGQYGVKQLPTKFLLDEKGRIVGMDQSPEQTERLLASQLP